MIITRSLPNLPARASAPPPVEGATCSLADQRYIHDQLSTASMEYDSTKALYLVGAGSTLGTGMAAWGTATGQMGLLAGLAVTAGAAGMAGFCLWAGHRGSQEVDGMLKDVARFNQAHGCYTNQQLEHLWQTAI